MLPIGILLNQLPPHVKNLTRKLERTEKKLVNCSTGVSFLKICIQENLLPKFTDIKSYDPASKQRDFTQNYRQEVLHYELENQLNR